MGCLPQNRLHVDSNFQKIYDSDECAGDFHSCMVDKGFHTFYELSLIHILPKEEVKALREKFELTYGHRKSPDGG